MSSLEKCSFKSCAHFLDGLFDYLLLSFKFLFFFCWFITLYKFHVYNILGFPCGSVGKESTCSAGDLGSIPGLGRSPGEGMGYPLQYSGLENSMDSTVHGVARGRTQLSDFHFHFIQHSISIFSAVCSPTKVCLPSVTIQSLPFTQFNLAPAPSPSITTTLFSVFMC